MKSVIIGTACLCLAFASACFARPIANGERFTGPEGYAWAAQTGGKPHSLNLDGDTYRFEIRTDDHWSHDIGSARNRSEITGLTVPSQGWSSISYDVMIEQGDFSAPGEHVVGQRHGTRDADDAPNEHPDIAFRILQGGRPGLTVAGSAEQPLKTIPKSQYPWTGDASQFAPGVWHTLRIDALSGDNGWVDLWLDGRLMKTNAGDAHTYSGPFGYVNAKDDYWKFGDYCAHGTVSPVAIKVRNIRRETAATPPATK
jgi:hypothetical protein